MSYDIIRSFGIDRKNLRINIEVASSNVTDYAGRRIYEKVVQEFKTEEELKHSLVGYANGILGGYYVFPRMHTMNKRVAFLKEQGYLEKVDSDGEWYKVKEDNEFVQDVLIGKKRIPTELYILSNRAYGLFFGKSSVGVRSVQDATKFFTKSEALNVLNRLKSDKEMWEYLERVGMSNMEVIRIK